MNYFMLWKLFLVLVYAINICQKLYLTEQQSEMDLANKIYTCENRFHRKLRKKCYL